MKKRLFILLAGCASLLGLSSFTSAGPGPDYIEVINNIDNTTPLYLNHASDTISLGGDVLNMHYSHSSHVSHASHASHQSHYSSYRY